MDHKIKQMAAFWLECQDELNAETREQFQQWLEASPEHQKAFNDLESIFNSSELTESLIAIRYREAKEFRLSAKEQDRNSQDLNVIATITPLRLLSWLKNFSFKFFNISSLPLMTSIAASMLVIGIAGVFFWTTED